LLMGVSFVSHKVRPAQAVSTFFVPWVPTKASIGRVPRFQTTSRIPLTTP